MLGRLLAHRRAAPATVAPAAGVSVLELDAVLAGGHADDSLLRRLAPALGLHTADLFVIAGHVLPDDLAPARQTRPSVTDVLRWGMRLYSRRFDSLHELVRSFPVDLPAEPPPPPPRYAAGMGALVMDLLANRNIRMHPHLAPVLRDVGDAPHGEVVGIVEALNDESKLTPRYVTAFAAVLGMPAGDLAALTGIGPPVAARLYPRHARLAALAWDARRLNSEQLVRVGQLAAYLERVDSRCPPPGKAHLWAPPPSGGGAHQSRSPESACHIEVH